MTESVKQLVRDSGYPNMRVLEFAFDERDTGNASDYLPHNYPRNCVVYTGTHDNETLVSWLGNITPKERRMVRTYLGLDDRARTNKPSTLGINWKWRLREGQFSKELQEEMKELAITYGR